MRLLVDNKNILQKIWFKLKYSISFAEAIKIQGIWKSPVQYHEGYDMNIECPHCEVDFNSEDIAHTLKNGYYICPVCEKKIPAPSANNRNTPVSFISRKKYIIPILMIVGIIALTVFFFLKSSDKSPEKANPITAIKTEPVSQQSPPPINVPPDSPASQETIPASQAPQIQQQPDKMKIVEQIAAEFHKNHSYTLEGEFVCLDMAINIWNQLMTKGIEAKIVGGNIRENITAWNYRQLAFASNHAWVVATVSPTEKVAIETTEGTVIKPGMKDYSTYFKGIMFDSPAEIKRFELLRKKMNDVCRDAKQMITDWNQNVSGQQLHPAEIVARKSRLEQRKQDCENTFKELQEFESKAVFY